MAYILSGAATAYAVINFPVTTRVAPTGISISNGTHFRVRNVGGTPVGTTGVIFDTANTSSGGIVAQGLTTMTAGDGSAFGGNNSSALLLFTGCEL